MLAVATTAVLAVALLASARLLAAPRQSPLLMSVLGINAAELARSQSHAETHEPLVSSVSIVDDPISEPASELVESDSDASDPDLRWFNGRPVRPASTMTMLVTAYSPDERSCGSQADGITASGYSVWTNGMRLVAADTRVLPFGSLVSVPGYGEDEIVPVLDRGGKIKGHRLDVLYSTHEIAKRWGAQRLEVTIWEYADGKPNGFRTQH